LEFWEIVWRYESGHPPLRVRKELPHVPPESLKIPSESNGDPQTHTQGKEGREERRGREREKEGKAKGNVSKGKRVQGLSM